MDMMSVIKDNLLVLIPALYVIGVVIKKTETVNDKYIPVILLGLGVLGAVGLAGLSVDSVIQGVLVAGATVLGNQIGKQINK